MLTIQCTGPHGWDVDTEESFLISCLQKGHAKKMGFPTSVALIQIIPHRTSLKFSQVILDSVKLTVNNHHQRGL